MKTYDYAVIIIVLVLLSSLLTGCSLGQKSWGMATSCDAFKVVLADPQSTSLAPTVVAGGASHAMAFQKPFVDGEKVPTMFVFSRRKSMWGMFSGDVNAGNVSVVYVAGSDEKPEHTSKILEQLEKIVNPPAPAD